MPDKNYTVFTCDPAAQLERVTAATGERDPGEELLADEWWRQHGPIGAKSETAAIDKLRDMDPDLKGNPAVLFFAVANHRPRKMIRQVIEKFTLGYADEDEPDDDRQASLDYPRDGKEGS